MPRKSRNDIAIAAAVPDRTERPGPPAGMTDEQKFEWMAIVNESAADRFSRDQLPMLEAYCRHRIALRHVGELVRQCEDDKELNVAHYDRLLKMQERESRAMASIGVRLGFAHTTRGKHGKDKQTIRNPWE